MNKFNKLYNIIMQDYYVKDIPAVDEFSKSFKQIFNIVGNKIKEDPTLVEKIQAKAQELANNPRITKARALLTAFVDIDGLNEQEQQKFDNFKKTLSNANVNNYIHHTVQDIISLAKRAGVTVKGTNGGKPKHYFGESVVKESYDPEDMYGGVYEPCYPGEEFELKVDQLFNMMERQIKKNPKLLDTLQWKIDYSVNKGTPIERAILLHICGLLRVQKISFEEKDLIKNFYNYFGDVNQLKELLSMVPLLKLAQNIGLNV